MEVISGELEIIIKKLCDEKCVSDWKFIYASLTTPESAVFQFLKKNLLSTDFKSISEKFKAEESKNVSDAVMDYFDGKVKACSQNNKCVTSLLIFGNILENNEEIGAYFKQYGINRMGVVSECVKSLNGNGSNFLKKKATGKITSQQVKTVKPSSNDITTNNGGDYVEKQLINISDDVNVNDNLFFFGNTDIIDTIWDSCLTKSNRTIVVKGEFSTGNLITYLAYLLNKGEVPEPLKGRKIFKVDFPALTNDISLKGVFESKFRKIIDKVVSKGKYILVVDNSDGVVDDESYKDYHFGLMVSEMVDVEKIPLLILGKPCKSLKPHQYKTIDLEQYSNSEVFEIAKRMVCNLQDYHNVNIEEQLVIKMFNKVGNDLRQCMTMYQLLDYISAHKVKEKEEYKELNVLCEKISVLNKKIDVTIESSNEYNEDLVDELSDKVMELNAQLRQTEKKINMDKSPIMVTCSDMKIYLQNIVDDKREINKGVYTIWLNYLNETNDKDVTVIKDDNRTRLKSLNQEVKDVVIGQNEAIDQLCQVVKKQQLGFNMGKPSVVLCTGSTGVGKTYLCKTIAKKIFGDEKYLVRLDMSEYAEKNSVAKLYGTSAGYVGYENGGILTEAVKKVKKGILLLDEIEKAHSEVFDAFLQVFDEGRLTDNHGETVSFKDFVIVMTSNVGAEESMRNQGGIGFKKQDIDEYKKDVIEKVMKSRFKPEFLNRIDSVVHFQTLSEDNLKMIIRLELDKLVNNIKTIGYIVGNEPYGDDLVDYLFDLVKEDKEYGARPIIRVIKNEVENKIIQKIIDEDIEKGYTFDKIWSKN